MTKWTPGEWRVEPGTWSVWGCCDAWDQSTNGFGYPIFKPYQSPWRDKPNREEMDANVQLISAAPDLYEALHLFSRLERDLTGVVAPDLFHRAEAALRKARGEE